MFVCQNFCFFFLKTINATVAAAKRGKSINIESSGIEEVESGVGVDGAGVAGVGVKGACVAGIGVAGVGEFEIGLADANGVGVWVGIVDVEIRS